LIKLFSLRSAKASIIDDNIYQSGY